MITNAILIKEELAELVGEEGGGLLEGWLIGMADRDG